MFRFRPDCSGGGRQNGLPLYRRAVGILAVDGAEGTGQVPPGHRAGPGGVSIHHEAAAVPLPRRNGRQRRFRPQSGFQRQGPDAQAERQRGRAGTPPQKQRIDRVAQRPRQILQQRLVLAFEPDKKDRVGQVIPPGDIRRIRRSALAAGGLHLPGRRITGGVEILQ